MKTLKESILEKRFLKKQKLLMKRFLNAICTSNPDYKLLNQLLKEGCDINYNSSEALSIACLNNNIELVKFLVDKKAEITFEMVSDAEKEGNLDIVSFLLKKSKKISHESVKIFLEKEKKRYGIIGHTLCDNYVSEHYGKNRFDGGEHMGGNTELGLYGRWYYDGKGYVLKLTANEKTEKIVSAELRKSS
jgi:ankyrin repeat protein